MKTSLSILMIHEYYFPEMTGTGRRTRELAESFAKNGHKVTVLTSFPRAFRSMSDLNCKSYEKLNGVDVYRIKNIFEVKDIVFLRMLSYLFFILFSIKKALKLSKDSDLIISVAPISSAIIGALVKIINKKYHHFDVPDILPDLGIAAGMIKNKWLIIILYKLEKWVYKHSNSISTCTRGQSGNIISKGVSSNKISHIPDWIDTSFFDNYLKINKNECKNIYKYPGKKLVSFFGNIGALQNPKIFIETMQSLNDDNYHDILFLFFGDGIMLQELKSMVREKCIKNVKFVGRIQREHVPACMTMSDILITNYVPDEHLDLYIPGKLFEYAISKRPIIMGSRGDSRKLIEEYSLGIAIEPSDLEEFKKEIINILYGTYEHRPNIEKFRADYSLANVVKLYDEIIYNN